MVTGVRAFDADEPTLLGLRRLTAAPPPIRELVPDLNRRWETAILNCLQREPSRRPQTARQAVEPLKGVVAAQFAGLNRIAVLGGAAALVTLLVWLGIGWRSPRGEATIPHSRIAVIGFKNAVGNHEAAWISTALVMFLTAKLSAGDKLETIPDDEIARMKADLALAESDQLPKDTLNRIRSRINADLVILGSYREHAGQVSFRVQAMDTATGTTCGLVEETGNSAALLDVFSKVGNRLRTTLRLRPPSQHEDDEALASLPSNLDALRLYSSGLNELQRFDALTGRDQLAQAVQMDPRYPLTHSALAEAWSVLGFDEKAATEAGAAFDRSGRLSWRDRQLIEGRYREMSKQWGLAADIYRRLWNAYPGEIDYALRLASVQSSAGTASEALATLTKLRSVATHGQDDPRIDFAEALASSGSKAQLAAAKAAKGARATGRRQLFAAARRIEGRTLFALGNGKEALEALSQAKEIYSKVGDRAR